MARSPSLGWGARVFGSPGHLRLTVAGLRASTGEWKPSTFQPSSQQSVYSSSGPPDVLSPIVRPVNAIKARTSLLPGKSHPGLTSGLYQPPLWDTGHLPGRVFVYFQTANEAMHLLQGDIRVLSLPINWQLKLASPAHATA